METLFWGVGASVIGAIVTPTVEEMVHGAQPETREVVVRVPQKPPHGGGEWRYVMHCEGPCPVIWRNQ